MCAFSCRFIHFVRGCSTRTLGLAYTSTPPSAARLLEMGMSLPQRLAVGQPLLAPVSGLIGLSVGWSRADTRAGAKPSQANVSVAPPPGRVETTETTVLWDKLACRKDQASSPSPRRVTQFNSTGLCRILTVSPRPTSGKPLVLTGKFFHFGIGNGRYRRDDPDFWEERCPTG